MQKVILGPPGTGKTTRLLQIVEGRLKENISPSSIGFISFTKRAAEEAITRAAEKFDLPVKAFTYFRTLHSLCYMQLGVQQHEVMKRDNYRELGEMLGIEIAGANLEEEEEVLPMGDIMLFIEGLHRLRCVDLRQQWIDSDRPDVDFEELESFANGLKEYKSSRNLIDFTDMLSRAVTQNSWPMLDTLLVDEAQDLSRLQWQVVKELMKFAKTTIIAGDDDQAIFRWAGADIETFLALDGDIEVLDKSYRLPKTVHKLATEVSAKIEERKEKHFHGTEKEGAVIHVSSLDEVPFGTGKFLVLARNGYTVQKASYFFMEEGLDFDFKTRGARHWPSLKAARAWTKMMKGESIDREENQLLSRFIGNHIILGDLKVPGNTPWYEALTKIPVRERDYLQEALRRKENFLAAPRIRLSTIHGAKGAEEENVVLITDMSARTYSNYQDNPDDENRVLYVAITRAKTNLYIVEGQTDMAYDV